MMQKLSSLASSVVNEISPRDGATALEVMPQKEPRTVRAGNADHPSGIDKSVLAVAAPRRYRNRAHLRYVAQQACLVCGRKPSDPHHLRHVQPRALGRKASDEFAVPLCRSPSSSRPPCKQRAKMVAGGGYRPRQDRTQALEAHASE
jgi:hypothetical protein